MAAERPLLMSSRFQDPEQKIQFMEGRFVKVAGGSAALEVPDGAVYTVISVPNVGTGLAVMHGWHVEVTGQPQQTHPPLEGFHRPDPRHLRGVRRRRILAGSVARSGHSPVQGPSPPQSRLATR
jgi:hypothetical protein